jgi:hypothetical protein
VPSTSIFDADWRFAWMSSEFKVVMGETDPARLGLGQHTLVVQGYPASGLGCGGRRPRARGFGSRC